MAISVVSAVQAQDGSVTVTGSEFTKTTTTVYVDGAPTPFEWISAEQIVVSGVDPEAVNVTVEKGGIEETVAISDEEEPAVAEEPVVNTLEEIEPSAITAGTWPNPIDGFRAAVAGVALTGLIPVGDEKTPYPTGTQLGAGKKFWLQNGYYKSATPT